MLAGEHEKHQEKCKMHTGLIKKNVKHTTHNTHTKKCWKINERHMLKTKKWPKEGHWKQTNKHTHQDFLKRCRFYICRDCSQCISELCIAQDITYLVILT